MTEWTLERMCFRGCREFSFWLGMHSYSNFWVVLKRAKSSCKSLVRVHPKVFPFCSLLGDKISFSVMDEDFFIFKLAVKPSETTFKMKLDNGLIRTAESYGPCFGSAQETNVHCVVLIDSEPNRNMCACMGFENHTTAEGVTVSRKTLAGDEQFLLTKMEVFQIE